MNQLKNKVISNENKMQLKSISSFLKNYRVLSGYTQEQISLIAEVNRSSIIRAESGYPVSLITVLKISSALELPLHELFLEIE